MNALTQRRNRRGFSLVEILITIALIAALLGILVPAIQRARSKVRVLVGGNEKAIPLDGIRGNWPFVNQGFGGFAPANPNNITWEPDDPSGGDVPIFNGTNGYMDSAAFSMTTDTATIAGWVRLKSSKSWAAVAFSRGAGGRVNGLNVNGTRVSYHWNDSGSSWGFSGGPTITLNEWWFVAVVIEPTQATLYARQVKEDEDTPMLSAVNTASHSEQVIDTLEFGRDPCCGGRYLHGNMRDIYMYDEALTAEQIMDLSKGGGTDLGAAGRYMSDIGAAANRGNDVLPGQ